MQFGLEDFVVRVRQQTADIGCLVYQMIRPTHTGCCERKKHETIHSIKAIYLQNFVFFSAHNTPSEKNMDGLHTYTKQLCCFGLDMMV